MSFYVGDFEFEGPGLLPAQLKDEAGVFLLLHRLHNDDSYELLDLGHFPRLRTSWESVDFEHFKQSHAGEVSLAAYYCGDLATGREVIKVIRREFGQMPGSQRLIISTDNLTSRQPV